MTYEQAYKDHKYLWAIAPANEMTGGYVDQDDLDRMLKKPTKTTAKACLCAQIDYWFANGVDNNDDTRTAADMAEDDPHVQDIADRHCCEPSAYKCQGPWT